ncbi:hypothetical protein [Mycolicibacterium aichiense]|uniref:Uncharacterized protein n=1 Tax=Mycolicibacterium aichiense TaxID=1799 RepID=A0AAD1MBT2_9MYCO|nr:hypothetical protein [Mycolicibacterium aichiense]MCV7020133.1 hypothetical protein [Mycolicibacterium aichiense]BBX07728.1 hypothetical protein MAIC_25310 [Mycolicibacterium aichiense]STZ81541.1 Uncharacterised protein [Mycolicibacterium aichiense]
MAVAELAIVASINGKKFPRADVLAWEDKRIDAAAKKIGVVPPSPGEVAARREEFVQIKQALGNDELHRRLARSATIADRMATAQASLTDRRRLCMTELFVPGGSAEQFTAWFNDITFSSNEYEMVRACPDHFVLRFVGGKQEVLETNGGSPLTALFDIDYDDISSITTPVDPAFPYRLDGVAIGSNGKPIGSVRHQFRDTPAGVHGRLLVEFPLPMIGTVIRGHRWHLACEFSNWIEAAIAADKG